MLRKIFRRLFVKKIQIITIGLDAAGNTIALYKLKFGKIVTIIPTISYK